MSKGTILAGRIDEGSYWSTVLGSVVAHVLLLLAIIFIPRFFPGPTIAPGSGGGGGGGNNEGVLPVVLAESSGGTGTYKPTPKPQPPAMEIAKPEPEPVKPDDIPLPDITKPPEKPKKKKEAPPPEETVKNRVQPEQTVKNPPKLARARVPTATGPGSGGLPGLSAGREGVGIGIGDGTGGSGGSGIGDSWYARQVEKRIGQNWLRGLFGNVPPGKFATVISFYVLDDGTIAKVSLVKSSSIFTLDESAKRAILASSPLTPLPPELRGKPVKFTAYFEYPPPSGR